MDDFEECSSAMVTLYSRAAVTPVRALEETLHSLVALSSCPRRTEAHTRIRSVRSHMRARVLAVHKRSDVAPAAAMVEAL